MKTKKLEKKMVLNKATIARLGNEKLQQVKGGVTNYACCTEDLHKCLTQCSINFCQ